MVFERTGGCKIDEKLMAIGEALIDFIPEESGKAMKDAHKKAIEYAKEAGAIISFDPNIRLALWENTSDLKAAILELFRWLSTPKAQMAQSATPEKPKHL